MRWVGIDEAGYGPNLGPLVMAAVVVESDDPDVPPTLDPPRRFWEDLATTTCRAGGPADRFAVDDSKAVMRGRKGRGALFSSCLALLDAVGRSIPDRPATLVATLPHDPYHVELSRWLDSDVSLPEWPGSDWLTVQKIRLMRRPFIPASGAWRITEVLVEVVGPERFNHGLDRHATKAGVHFEAFAALLQAVWDRACDGRPTLVRGDKHGGRHFYAGPLASAFPEARISRGAEGPELSEYALHAPGRKLTLRLTPRADADDALVALASIAAKTVRECWMDVFNAFWTRRVPGLKPSAGYPVDASRFRRDVEATAANLGVGPRLWWRER